MTLTVTLDPTHLAAALELRTILTEEKALADRKKAAKAILSEVLLEVGQTAIDPDGVIVATVKAGSKRFNAEEATRNLPAPLLKMIVQSVPDAGLAKELLPPAMYEKCCKATAPSIVPA